MAVKTLDASAVVAQVEFKQADKVAWF